MGFSLGAIASAIGGSALGLGSQAVGNWLTNSASESLAKNTLQTANAINFDYSARAAREMPSYQVEGLRRAGINPIVAYGSIGNNLDFSGGWGQAHSAFPVVDPNSLTRGEGLTSENVVKGNSLYQAGKVASAVAPAVSASVSSAVGLGLLAKYLKQAGAPKSTMKPVVGFATQEGLKAGTAAGLSSALSLKALGRAALRYIPQAALAAGAFYLRAKRAQEGGRNEKKLLNTPAHILMPLR